jgi:transposase
LVAKEVRAALVVVVGVDTHKKTHTFVGVDAVGRKLAELTVRATTVGHMTALGWAREAFGNDLVWGIEDCRNLSGRLERELLDALTEARPGLAAIARAMSRILDNPKAVSSQPAAAKVLTSLLDKLRSVSRRVTAGWQWCAG